MINIYSRRKAIVFRTGIILTLIWFVMLGVPFFKTNAALPANESQKTENEVVFETVDENADNNLLEPTPAPKASLAEKLADKLSGLPDEVICFVVSMVPIIELRGGLIIASIKGVPLWRAIGVCIAGNLVPIPFILLLITPIFAWLKKTKLFKPLVEKLEKKSMSKSDKIKKYEFLGLMLFVGIPLPGTGAWTGSLIAALLDIKIKKAFPAICLGLVMATIIMCFISYGIPWLISNVF